VPLGVDTMRGVGTMLGTCCVTVIADGTDPVACMQNLMQFYRHESCGQCTPCREGAPGSSAFVDKILDGKASMDRARYAARHRQQHHGQHHLRVRRRDGDAGARISPEVPARVRASHLRGERSGVEAKLAVEPWS
jgi:hypothetical protein